MQATVDAATMKKALRLLTSPEKGNYPIEIIASLVSGAKGNITINTHEGTKFVSLSFTGDVSKEGAVMFSSKYLRYLSKVDGDVLTISAGPTDCRINNFTIQMYSGPRPSCPETPETGSATFDLADIKTLFRRVLFAAGDDSDPSHNLRSVLLQCDQTYIKAVAGDGSIIVVSELKKGSPFTGRFVLPKGGVYVLSKLEGDIVTITFYEDPSGFGPKQTPRKAIKFSSFGDIVCHVYMPEFAAPFPRYENAFRVKGNTILTGNRDQLLACIREIKEVSNRVSISMRHLKYVKQEPRFYAREDDGSSHYDAHRPFEWSGDDLKISASASTLHGAIEQATGDVTISFTNEMAPFTVKGETDDYIAVLMPQV